MKHLKTFTELTESSSAGSQETNEILPFKYACVYDPRIGYNKSDFISDLEILFKKMSVSDKDDIKIIIKSLTGAGSIDSIMNLRSKELNLLMKAIEDFLDSKADFQLSIYPDGYVLCFENIKAGKRKYDIYFSPAKNNLKIVPQTGSAIEPEYVQSIEEFDPEKYGIEKEDFLKTLEQAKNIFMRKGISDRTPL